MCALDSARRLVTARFPQAIGSLLAGSALDDLLGCRDDAELVMIGARIVTAAAELALVERGRWLGRGKWLVRRLRAADTELADRLIDAFRRVVAAGDRTCLAQVTVQVLDEVGGPLAEGYRREGSTVQVNREVSR